jgi:hypothetical protein
MSCTVQRSVFIVSCISGWGFSFVVSCISGWVFSFVVCLFQWLGPLFCCVFVSVDGASPSFLVVLVSVTLPISYIRSLAIVNLNCWYDNFEPQEVRMVRSEMWENTIFVHF